jgi:hypothetical protein
MMLFGAPVFGAFIGGLLGTVLGLRLALVVSLISMTSPLLWIFFSPVFRLSEMPPGPPDTAPRTGPGDPTRATPDTEPGTGPQDLEGVPGTDEIHE